jgi:peptide/nickel transport system substrate-binding protein
VYGPDYFPTGGEIFAPGAGSNAGYYSSPVNDQNIAKTHTAPSQSAETTALFAYQNYLATQLPDVWLPTSPTQLTVYKSDLRGLVPQGVFAEIYPQDYSLGS